MVVGVGYIELTIEDFNPHSMLQSCEFLAPGFVAPDKETFPD